MKRTTLIIAALVVLIAAGVMFYGRLPDRSPERNPQRDATLVELEQFIGESQPLLSLV
ncbi:MAG: hypothetical protein SCK29_03445 [Bacillota bacterium]|nr:hypothetical protein [Bacillota bacterium]MDW7683159.1 hypothetical protein [Bacillota bacterium]